MVFITTIICSIVHLLFCLFFIKTYQLEGYKIKNFFQRILSLNFSFGDKNKLVFTKRIFRLMFFLLLVSYSTFFLVNFFTKTVFLIILFYSLILIFSPFFIVFSHFFALPIEIIIKKSYILKAKNKLNSLNIIKIGITGSYGKTSTKNILTALLEKEYKVCVSPKNYNTEMGLTKTILNNLL